MASFIRAFVLIMSMIGVSYAAEDIKVVGSFTQTVQLPHSSSYFHSVANRGPVKQISLLKIELSEKGQAAIEKRTQEVLTKSSMPQRASNAPANVQLGMANVPVLDQGSYGSCVTFANTAAIDAALGKGDYVSQLCSLQLGRYLEANGYNPSGWEGSFGGMVLNQIDAFGIVSKSREASQGCGGLTAYPLTISAGSLGTEMSPAEYHQLSEPIDHSVVAWSSLLDLYQIFLDKTNTDVLLQQVKLVLNEGDRITFGIFLPDVGQGLAGAVGKYHATYDSWVLTPEIAEDINSQAEFAGHELIITGYDDDAVALDERGRPHKGLLTLRNSWGADIGDRGNFYMSYDYFKALVIEAQRIRQLPSSS